MKKLRYWEWSEGAERAALAEAADELESITWQTSDLAARAQRLALRQQELAREVTSLRTVVRVLAELLIETNAVDHAVLSERVTAALAALDPPPPVERAVMPREHGGASYRDNGVAAVSPPPPRREVRCSQCQCMVPAGETTVTEDGTFCEECFRQVRLAQLGE